MESNVTSGYIGLVKQDYVTAPEVEVSLTNYNKWVVQEIMIVSRMWCNVNRVKIEFPLYDNTQRVNKECVTFKLL